MTTGDRDARVAELVDRISDYRDGSPTQVRLLTDARRDEFAAGYALGRRTSIDEGDVAAGLTSATARLIGLSKRDRRLEAIDHGVVFLTEIINRLDGFAGICGSDTGTEGIVVILREMVGYLRARD
jgi:ribosomal protein L13E